ncbi:MAG: hypothetical protein H6555_10220 [Lewinellaceae bacterium]|nr:hypothetical protein [Lewinellaceae bacterium]
MQQVYRRQGLSFLLIGVLFWQCAGSLLLFQCTLHQHRRETFYQLAAADFTLPLKTLSWHKNHPNPTIRWVNTREFRYNGKIQDVVRRTETDTTITIFYLTDETEENLLTQWGNRFYFDQPLGESSQNYHLLGWTLWGQSYLPSTFSPGMFALLSKVTSVRSMMGFVLFGIGVKPPTPPPWK